MYSPSLKVKRLLDSLAYFLLSGSMDNIETDYKMVMHSKREIPASNCPSYVDNMLYSSSVMTGNAKKEEQAEFIDMLERLDSRAKPYIQTKEKRDPKVESKFHKRQRLGIHGGEWCVVDTEGKFLFGGDVYEIDEDATQYQPIQTKYGDLYDMDRILAYDGRFYDMNFDEVHAHRS